MKDYYDEIKSEMEQSGICESDIQMVIKKIKELRKNSDSKKVSTDKMSRLKETD